MREPLENKATRPPLNKGRERFPIREGNRSISDRPLTKEEIDARQTERDAMARAKKFRADKARGSRES